MSDACDLSHRPERAEGNPDDAGIMEILATAKRIAVVGLSKKPHRASYAVGCYLRDQGYDVVPVHPNETEWEGIPVRRTLADVTGEVDIVDLFVNAANVAGLVEEIVALKPRCAWLQLGIVNNEAARKLRTAGIAVVQDRCTKIEHFRLIASR